MNRLVGEDLSIITAKAQTTRHRIMGLLHGDDFQIVYSDTPGLLEPNYELQRAMMNFVNVSLEDADVILMVVDVNEVYDPTLFSRFKSLTTPILLLINKIDLANARAVADKIRYWNDQLSPGRNHRGIGFGGGEPKSNFARYHRPSSGTSRVLSKR